MVRPWRREITEAAQRYYAEHDRQSLGYLYQRTSDLAWESGHRMAAVRLLLAEHWVAIRCGDERRQRESPYFLAMRHRLQAEGERPVFRAGELSVDLVRRIATLAGEEIKLSPKEYALLSLLVRNAGKVLTHSHILNELWSGAADTQYIRIYIRSLRQKLREAPENPRYILTEQGVGYRFRDPAETE